MEIASIEFIHRIIHTSLDYKVGLPIRKQRTREFGECPKNDVVILARLLLNSLFDYSELSEPVRKEYTPRLA